MSENSSLLLSQLFISLSDVNGSNSSEQNSNVERQIFISNNFSCAQHTLFSFSGMRPEYYCYFSDFTIDVFNE